MHENTMKKNICKKRAQIDMLMEYKCNDVLVHILTRFSVIHVE